MAFLYISNPKGIASNHACKWSSFLVADMADKNNN